MSRRRRVRFEQAAEEDLKQAWRFICSDSGSHCADAVVDRIVTACRGLEHLPELGRSVPELGPQIRMLVVHLFRVLYLPAANYVLVLRVIHGRRDLPTAWRERDPTAHS